MKEVQKKDIMMKRRRYLKGVQRIKKKSIQRECGEISKVNLIKEKNKS